MGGRQAGALLSLVLAVAHPCLAEDTFDAEAGLSYSKISFDAERQQTAGVDATYYFDKLPSQPKDIPYDQVQFVERVGSVSANYAVTSVDLDGFDTVSKGSNYGVAVQFARPDLPLLASARYDSLSTGKHQAPAGSEFHADSKIVQLAIGAYVARTTALSLDWSRSETRNVNSGLPDTTNTATFVGLSGQHLGMFPGGGHVALSASAMQIARESDDGSPSEKNKELSVTGIYYPQKMLGLKLGVAVDRGDHKSWEGEAYLVGAKTFFTPAFSLSLDYVKFNAKTAGNGFDAVMLRGAMRF